MKALGLVFLTIFVMGACRKEEPAPVQPDTAPAAVQPVNHRDEILKWQKRRAERLMAEDGWLSLAGLHWLAEGENPLTVPNATTPPGTLTLKGEVVTLQPGTPSVPMTIEGKPVAGPVVLLNDSEEKGPTIVQMGTVRFQIIKRGQRYGVRVKDSQAKTRTEFAGLEYFPIDEKWRVEARLEPYNPAKMIPITDVTGMTSDNESPGALVFTLEGQEMRLDPILEEGSDELFIIFRDGTSRDATYPAGRYLYAPKPGPDGKVIVDFNKAYNPPCAFTPFATCPLPPLQNRLPVRVEAGEKKYSGAH